jgi:hypothetical protein
MAEPERARRTAGAFVWIVRLVLILATYVLVRYGSHLLTEWLIKSRANFAFFPWDWLGALAILVLTGIVFVMAARFPFPRPRFAWGALLVALLIAVPSIHFTLIASGWISSPTWWFPSWVFGPWWFDTSTIAETSALLAGVAIGCGSGARREAPA